MKLKDYVINILRTDNGNAYEWERESISKAKYIDVMLWDEQAYDYIESCSFCSALDVLLKCDADWLDYEVNDVDFLDDINEPLFRFELVSRAQQRSYGLPETYAEIEYNDYDSEEAMMGCRFDDMNYLRYVER